MWDCQARRKNQYLHIMLGPDTNPVVINRSVNLALGKANTNSLDLCPPFILPASLVAGSFGLNPDSTKAPLAFGSWGIPKLIRDINSHDRVLRLKSLRSLIDELQDPTKLYHALNLFIAKRLNDSLDKIIYSIVDCDLDTRPIEVQTVFHNMVVLGENLDGAISIIKQDKLMDKIFVLIPFDNIQIRETALKILSVLANHQKVAEDMNNLNYLERIKEYLNIVEPIDYFYSFIEGLIERSPKLGMAHGYFDILLPKITVQNSTQRNVMKAFAVLVTCPEAHDLCDKKDVIQILYKIMKDEKIKDDIMLYVVIALQNITITTRSRWRCREFWDITVVLIELAHRKTCAELQLVCLQALRQITEMPSVKKFTRKVGHDFLRKIRCSSNENLQKRNKLIAWLNHKPYPEYE